MSEERSEEESPKLSIKELLKVIPPPQALREEKKLKEKRVRISHSDEIEEGSVMIHPKLADQLGIKDYLEISVKGKRLRFKAIISEKCPEDNLIGNRAELMRNGIANNSLVVVRRVE
ncbi:MAG: hypothetical protein ABWJ42_00750 [Sulfolobales archaeon]